MENNFRCHFIGVAGVATAGKDTFCKLLSEKLHDVKRYALADRLKSELSGFVRHYYGVDIMLCDAKTKEMLRPLMLFHGLMMRARTEGQYWIRCLTEEIRKDNPEGTVVITDIRYAQYGKNDEISWLKEKIGGCLVYINRHKVISGVKVYVDPPNVEEARNNEALKNSADYIIDWPTIYGSEDEVEEALEPYVDEFVDWYKKECPII
jgi:hypothetical protein